MFDFLKKARSTDALPAGHHAIQVLRQWRYSMTPDDRLGTIGETNLSAEQSEMVKGIIEEIEQHTKTPIQEISEDEAAKYYLLLAVILHDLGSLSFKADSNKGKGLLEELRGDLNTDINRK